jgi:hypothetical protein
MNASIMSEAQCLENEIQRLLLVHSPLLMTLQLLKRFRNKNSASRTLGKQQREPLAEAGRAVRKKSFQHYQRQFLTY